MADYIDQQLRRTNRNLVGLNLLFLAFFTFIVFLILRNTRGHLDSGRVIGLAAVAVFVLVIAINLLRWRSRRSNPQKHPIYRSLRSYGDPERVREHIVKELGEIPPPVRFGAACVTQSWIITQSVWSLGLMGLHDLVWAYEMVTTQSVNGISTGTTNSVCFRGRSGCDLDVRLSRENVASLLAFVRNSQPWVVMGYDQQVAHAYQSDRASFAAAVDQRRNELKNIRR